ncbi:hypothetical protein D3C76_1544820 [compost metagenome]
MVGRRVVDNQVRFAVYQLYRPCQVLEPVLRAVFQMAGAIEQLDARTQGNVQNILPGIGRRLRNFLQVEIEQRLTVLRQVIG